MLSDSALREALQSIVDPLTGKDFITTRHLSWSSPEPDRVVLRLALPYPARSHWPALQQSLEAAVVAVAPHLKVSVEIDTQVLAHAVPRGQQLLSGVKNIIAVASGKGGVGKSTTAANLALALAVEGAHVGLLDADIYGPSQPWMMGLSGHQPKSLDGQVMEPLENHGVQVMSIGFLVDADHPMIWRGPMATQALDQLLRQTRWHDLDYLIVDMPPGTGDIQLTLSQRVPLTGAVIVTTPQDIALLDARKGLRMFEKVNVPILGIVENMAIHRCSECGHTSHIFGAEGGQKMAAQYGVEYLGGLPLALSIREQVDSGKPTVISEPEGSIAATYRDIARRMAVKISQFGKEYSSKFPIITVSGTT
ncbi:MAG: iron-sulfur cluster carrier protein ApbC [Burkholderiales bacterium]